MFHLNQNPDIRLKDFVQCVDNVLPEKFCDFFVEFIEDQIKSKTVERYDDGGTPNFWKADFTFSDKSLNNKEVNKAVAQMFNQHAKQYAMKLGLQNYFPKYYLFELIRVKKYDNNNYDEFYDHVDIGDKESSARFLNLFCYLNDVEEGGETDFPNLNISFKPKKGSLLMFPPNWFFPHAGRKPISGPKYILSTNLQYK